MKFAQAVLLIVTLYQIEALPQGIIIYSQQSVIQEYAPKFFTENEITNSLLTLMKTKASTILDEADRLITEFDSKVDPTLVVLHDAVTKLSESPLMNEEKVTCLKNAAENIQKIGKNIEDPCLQSSKLADITKAMSDLEKVSQMGKKAIQICSLMNFLDVDEDLKKCLDDYLNDIKSKRDQAEIDLNNNLETNNISNLENCLSNKEPDVITAIKNSGVNAFQCLSQ